MNLKTTYEKHFGYLDSDEVAEALSSLLGPGVKRIELETFGGNTPQVSKLVKQGDTITILITN